MIRIKSTYFTVNILVALLVVFGCVTQLGFAQQHLETLQTIILDDQRALQGITSDGEFFYTSTGTCTPDCGKDGPSIFRFDQDWWETDDQPLPLCHLGDISVDDTFVYVPSRGANFPPGPYEIRRFNRTTFEEASTYWSLDAVADEYSGEITAGLDIHDGDLFLIEYQEDGPDNAHIIHIDIAKLYVVGDYEISTRFANGIEFYGNYIYIANGSRDDPFGYIDVYDFEVMEHGGVNEPIATYSYDIDGGPCFGIGEHAEGLTFRGTELWVCAATGDEVRKIETPILPPDPSGACCVWESCTIETSTNCDSMGGNYFGNNSFCSTETCWDADGVLYVPSEYPDIQKAINVSVDTDLILIEAGTYYPSSTIDTQGKAITIRGAVNGSGAPMTTLDGQGNKQVIRCESGEGFDTIFENLVISGGYATYGGGMYNSSSTPALENCIFTNNTAYFGGGMYNTSIPTLTDTTICGNTPDQIYGNWTDNGGNWVADECPVDCPDINGDGYVNVTDLLVVIDQWGQTDSAADLNFDGIVEVNDLIAIIENWGPCE